MKKSIVSIFMSIFLMFIFSGCVQKMERAPIAEDKLAKEFKTDPDFANLYIVEMNLLVGLSICLCW